MDIIEKWQEVMTEIGYNGNKLEKLCEYCEEHLKRTQENNLNVSDCKMETNLLPSSLKVLTRIKELDNINLEIVENTEKKLIFEDNKVKVLEEGNVNSHYAIVEVDDMTDLSNEKIDEMIDKLVKKTSINLNNQLKPNDTLVIGKIFCENITIHSGNNFDNPALSLKTNYKIISA